MNSLDRYLSMLRGQAVDFVPRVPILMQLAAESIQSNYGAFASDYRVLVEANAGCEIPSGTPRDNLLALCRILPYRP